MNILQRIARLERDRPPDAACAVCGGIGPYVVHYMNPLPELDAPPMADGCAACGRRTVITVEFVETPLGQIGRGEPRGV